MADALETVKAYQALVADGKIDEASEYFDDNVTFSNPMTGTVTGKDAAVSALRNRPEMPGMTLTWREPEMAGDDVKMIGDGLPFGPIHMLLSVADNKITKIAIAMGA